MAGENRSSFFMNSPSKLPFRSGRSVISHKETIKVVPRLFVLRKAWFFIYKEIAFKSEKNKNDTNITKHYPKRNKQSFKF